MNSTCRILATQAASKGLEFVVSIMPEVPPALRGDPYYLRQILINLAGNAIKFTERGSVTVHVSAQLETAAAVRLKFSIRDTGIGFCRVGLGADRRSQRRGGGRASRRGDQPRQALSQRAYLFRERGYQPRAPLP